MIENGDWVDLTEFDSIDEASRAGALLLESGIVAALGEDDTSPTMLSVLPDDVARACEILGVDEPATPVLPLDQPLPTEATRWRFPRERMALFVIGYIVVLVGLSVGVFFVVAWILGGFDSTEVPPVTVGR